VSLPERRRVRRHPSLVVGAALCALLVATAAVSLVWTPYPPTDLDIPRKLALPAAEHWFGTDNLGRDVLSLIMAGARNSILVGVIAVAIGLVIGTAVGTLAAATKGWVEEIAMRLSDFTFAFPAVLSAIMLTSTFGPGIVNSITAIGIFNI